MRDVKVILNREAVRELMQSKEMMALCEKKAYEAKSQLGNGYEVDSMVGKTRVNASIAAVSPKAKRENARNNTILKALKHD